MKGVNVIFSYVFKRHYKLKQCIYANWQEYLDRLEFIEEKKVKLFYQQVIACIMADTYELYIENSQGKNPFYHNAKKLTQKGGQSFLKWVATYYTLQFLKKEGYSAHIDKMEKSLFYIFQFNEKEKEEFYHFKLLLETEESIYEVEFGKHLTVQVIGETDHGLYILAQVYHYLYNSYESFKKSFLTYTNFESKLA